MDKVHAPLKPADVGAPQLEYHDPAEPVVIPLLMEERDKLKEIFKDPAFVKAWRNLRVLKPSVFIATPSALAGPSGAQMANNRLHEIRGWEMFSAALLNQAKEPVIKTKVNLDEYPDAGTIEGEALRTAGFTPQPAKDPNKPPVSGYPKPPKNKPRLH